MAITNTSTPSFSTLGVGSGLDLQGMVDKLSAIEQQPLQNLQKTATKFNAKLSVYGQIQSLASALNSAVDGLTKPETYTGSVASSSDSSSVSATAAASATQGTYSVSVSQLAQNQVAVSPSGLLASSSTVVGTGSLKISIGTWAADNSFTATDAAKDITVTIDSSNNTLQGIRDAINNAKAGVTASIVTDASGARLTIQSSSTGTAQAFQITATDDDGNNTDNAGLSMFAYTQGAASGMSRTQASADTLATVNGISVRSSNTTITGAMDGVTLTANKVTTSPVTVSVSPNVGQVTGQFQAFVKAYNDLSNFLQQQTKYDQASQTGGVLQGDTATVNLANQLRSLLTTPTPNSSSLSTLNAMGVTLQRDGTLKIDTTKLNAAAGNLPELSKAMAGVKDASGAYKGGIAQRIDDWTTAATAAKGVITSRQDSLKASLKDNATQQTQLNDRVAAFKQRLLNQYASLDAKVASMNQLSAYVAKQFANQSSSN